MIASAIVSRAVLLACRLATVIAFNRTVYGNLMPRVTFDIHTSLSSEQVISMLTDFSPRRPDLWPMLAPELFEVYRVDANSADVKEGSLYPIRIWERDHYEWSADRVRWTVQESNYCKPGNYVEVTVRAEAGGGSQLHVDWNRRGAGIKGKILIALVVLTRGANIRRKVFQRALDQIGLV
jgi:hypothetical protein